MIFRNETLEFRLELAVAGRIGDAHQMFDTQPNPVRVFEPMFPYADLGMGGVADIFVRVGEFLKEFFTGANTGESNVNIACDPRSRKSPYSQNRNTNGSPQLAVEQDGKVVLELIVSDRSRD